MARSDKVIYRIAQGEFDGALASITEAVTERFLALAGLGGDEDTAAEADVPVDESEFVKFVPTHAFTPAAKAAPAKAAPAKASANGTAEIEVEVGKNFTVKNHPKAPELNGARVGVVEPGKNASVVQILRNGENATQDRVGRTTKIRHEFLAPARGRPSKLIQVEG